MNDEPVAEPPAEVAAPPAPTPGFGADLTVGYAVGTFSSPWARPGPAGSVVISLGLLPVPAHTAGPRVGGHFWAQVAALPLPERVEDCDPTTSACATETFRSLQFGVDLSFRSDPGSRWGGTFDFGFSNLVVEDWYDGPLAIPVFSVRPGVRRAAGPVFLEAGVRAGVGTQRGPTGLSEEWWVVSAELGVGLHVR